MLVPVGLDVYLKFIQLKENSNVCADFRVCLCTLTTTRIAPATANLVQVVSFKILHLKMQINLIVLTIF